MTAERPRLGARCLAEMIGTFGLVFAGCGAIVVDRLADGRITHVGIGLTFGLTVMAMIYATGHISGAHLNPAVTLGFVAGGNFPVRETAPYWVAQLAGAVGAAATLKGLFPGTTTLGQTVPLASARQSLFLEVLLTFFLMFVITAVATDARAEGGGAALAIGGTVAFEAIFAGPISGASMNPARSFGPALLAGQFQAHWIYWLGPGIGALSGALAYQVAGSRVPGFAPAPRGRRPPSLERH